MKNFKPMFKVFKAGKTAEPIVILKGDLPFNIEAKKAKYISLGYKIIEL
jgi:hypothetical protein